MVDHDPHVREAMEMLLRDPFRNVRIAAARALGARTDPDSKAGLELLACLKYQADQPAGQLQRAIFDTTYRDNASALSHLERALAWDKRSPDIRDEAAVLYGMLGKPQEALAQSEVACRLDPGNAQYAFARGLAAAEVGNNAEALEAMEKAVQLDPGFSRAWYNLGLMQQNAGKPDAAMTAFKNAEAADADDAQIPYAEAVLLSQLGRNAEARKAAERALAKAPGYPEATELLRNLPP
jgi:tetratricopeptide (TPR) repeat protein